MQKLLIASAIAGLSMLTTHTKADVMVGAYVDGNGWSQENIVSLNDQLTKNLSFVTLFSAFSEDWDLLYWQASKVADLEMVPMISWMPLDQSRPDENILPEISLGMWDDYLDQWASRYIDWRNTYPDGSKPTILLRFGHEFNGNWYSYGDSPDWYKAAYQYVYDRFESQGINEHIEWVWCANNINVDAANDITAYYPGDNYVDWTSIDGYNWGSNYSWTSWDSFTDVYADSYNTLVSNYPDKPILIAEFGSAEPTDLPDPDWGQNGDDSDNHESKDAWSTDMLAVLEQDFPAVRAISLFNINKELDWSLTETGNTGLGGFNTGLASPYYISEYNTSLSSEIVQASADTETAPSGKAAKSNKGGNSASNRDTAGASKRTITAEEQVQLAHSRALPKAKRQNVEKMRRGFLTMNQNARKKLKQLKLSVIGSE